MAFIEIMNLKQRNEFCCQVVMGVNPHPSIFSKDNIPGGCDVKVYFMLFHFIFYNFVEIYKVVLVLQWRRKFLGMMKFLVKFDETKGRRSFKSLESLME